MTTVTAATAERVLTPRGYAVKKATVPLEELEALKKELTVAPLDAFSGAGGPPPASFKIYAESPTRLYVPRHWGRAKWGPPELSLIPQGAALSPTAHFQGEPFGYQQTIIDMFLATGTTGANGGLLCVPCGKGKTFMALAIAARIGKRFCIVVDKEFLLQQWKGEIERFFPGVTVGILQGDRCQVGTETIPGRSLTNEELKELCRSHKLPVGGNKEVLTKRLQAAGVPTETEATTQTYDCTICMIQTVIQREFPASTFSGFGFTIFDECHHLGAAQFSKVLGKIQTDWMVGLSATPTRDDGLTKVFEAYLGEAVYWEKTREPDATVAVYVRHFDFTESAYTDTPLDFRGDICIARLLSTVMAYRPRTEAIAAVLAAWIRESPARRILVLSERICLLEELEVLLKPLNVLIGYYIGGMKEEVREAAGRDARILLGTYAMASEAMNIKTLNAVALASPRKKITQSTGRILRLRPEERSVEHRILDFVDSHGPYQGQWRKRHLYYKQCKYKMYTLDASGTATPFAAARGDAPKLDLNVCQFVD